MNRHHESDKSLGKACSIRWLSEGDAQYKHVEGAWMDTRPTVNTMSNDLNDMVPEVEAWDIQKISKRYLTSASHDDTHDLT
jgi:hypothetical protein